MTTPKYKRLCEKCRVVIFNRPKNAKYCKGCSTEKLKEGNRVNSQKYRDKNKL